MRSGVKYAGKNFIDIENLQARLTNANVTQRPSLIILCSIAKHLIRLFRSNGSLKTTDDNYSGITVIFSHGSMKFSSNNNRPSRLNAPIRRIAARTARTGARGCRKEAIKSREK